MTGKPPHRPSGKTGAQEWERHDPKLRKNAYASDPPRRDLDEAHHHAEDEGERVRGGRRKHT